MKSKVSHLLEPEKRLAITTLYLYIYNYISAYIRAVDLYYLSTGTRICFSFGGRGRGGGGIEVFQKCLHEQISKRVCEREKQREMGREGGQRDRLTDGLTDKISD